MNKPLLLSAASFLVGAILSLGQTAPADMQLFLLIGQSNMAGRGVVEPQDQVTNPHIFMLTQYYEWLLAKDPAHFDRPALIGVGLCSEFARTLVKDDPKITVGLIPCAVGGTSLGEWKPGGELYTNAIVRAREAMKNGNLVGILWHQGESDIPGNPETYNERFAAMIQQLRSDLHAENVPVIVGELGHYLTQPNAAKLRTVLSELPKSLPICGFVSSEGLTPKVDNLHFDAPSLRTFGARYAAVWIEMTHKATRPLVGR